MKISRYTFIRNLKLEEKKKEEKHVSSQTLQEFLTVR